MDWQLAQMVSGREVTLMTLAVIEAVNSGDDGDWQLVAVVGTTEKECWCFDGRDRNIGNQSLVIRVTGNRRFC